MIYCNGQCHFPNWCRSWISILHSIGQFYMFVSQNELYRLVYTDPQPMLYKKTHVLICVVLWFVVIRVLTKVLWYVNIYFSKLLTPAKWFVNTIQCFIHYSCQRHHGLVYEYETNPKIQAFKIMISFPVVYVTVQCINEIHHAGNYSFEILGTAISDTHPKRILNPILAKSR